jgi:hypothetical protein
MTEEQRAIFQKMDNWWKKRFLRLRCRDKCELCGEQPGSQMHHKTYERFGRELPEDLVLICRWCHESIHGIWLGWDLTNDRASECDGYWPRNEEEKKRIVHESRLRAAAIQNLRTEDALKEFRARRDAEWSRDDKSLFDVRRRGE